MKNIRGPITVTINKRRRVTLIECPNDLNAMLDLGKVADLALLLVDASFGFEMETFEFLNILQTHGFPKVMGILTHLDKLKTSKLQRKAKKQLRRRFASEIATGAKLFYLSGILHGHVSLRLAPFLPSLLYLTLSPPLLQYLRKEMENLHLYISRFNFRPIVWRASRPYLLADRFEDLTHEDEVQRHPKCDRTVCMYGYLRGTNLKPGQKVGEGAAYLCCCAFVVLRTEFL